MIFFVYLNMITNIEKIIFKNMYQQLTDTNVIQEKH